MKLVAIRPAKDGVHKYEAVFDKDGRQKTTKFGAVGYTDFTRGASLEQRAAYRKRHTNDREDHSDPTTAGALSYYILWGDSPSIRANISSFRKRFGI